MISRTGKLFFILCLFAAQMSAGGTSQTPNSGCESLVIIEPLPVQEWSRLLNANESSALADAPEAMELLLKTEVALRRALSFETEVQMHRLLRDLNKTLLEHQRALNLIIERHSNESLFPLGKSTASLLRSYRTQLKLTLESVSSFRSPPELEFGIYVEQRQRAHFRLSIVRRRIKALIFKFIVPNINIDRPVTGPQAPDDVIESGFNWIYIANIPRNSFDVESLLQKADWLNGLRLKLGQFNFRVEKITFVFEGTLPDHLKLQLAKKSVDVIELPNSINN